MFKKLIILISLSVIATPSFAAYTEIECSTDTVFTENSCNQCFNWGDKTQGNHIGLLSDLWMNVTDISKIIYKEEQIDPEMINLSSANVDWLQSTDEANFWEYTDEFNALYSDIDEGYVLPSWESVTWIKSSLSSVYTLEKNTATQWENIGLLVFPISTHNILADGEVTIDNSEHKECVLFKSGEASEVEEVVEPKKLPQTGPAEYILLLILSMILGFGILKFKSRA